MTTPVLLFSYGTLRQPEIQRALFGRLVTGSPDALAGWRIESVVITDPEVVTASGSAVHPILVPDLDAPAIEGMALAITPADLPAADAYETDAYTRIEVTLRSGRIAFVYVAAA